MTWTLIGQGFYNRVFVDEHKQKVLKVQARMRRKDESFFEQSALNALDLPQRSVGLWNSLYAEKYGLASVVKDPEHGLGWTCPFIKGTAATDLQMHSALIDVFNKTGRVVVDAPHPGNCIHTPEPDSTTVFVDIGLCVLVERKNTKPPLKRENSKTSLEALSILSNPLKQFLAKNEEQFPITVKTIKALLFISENCFEEDDTNFLRDEPDKLNLLAQAYDGLKEVQAEALNIVHQSNRLAIYQ